MQDEKDVSKMNAEYALGLKFVAQIEENKISKKVIDMLKSVNDLFTFF